MWICCWFDWPNASRNENAYKLQLADDHRCLVRKRNFWDRPVSKNSQHRTLLCTYECRNPPPARPSSPSRRHHLIAQSHTTIPLIFAGKHVRPCLRCAINGRIEFRSSTDKSCLLSGSSSRSHLHLVLHQDSVCSVRDMNHVPCHKCWITYLPFTAASVAVLGPYLWYSKRGLARGCWLICLGDVSTKQSLGYGDRQTATPSHSSYICILRCYLY